MPVREGSELVDAGGSVVGKVTSGGFGPTVGTPIAMGYVEAGLASAGTALQAIVRGQPVPLCVAPTTFVPPRYKRR
jgi:aminomethyltransferase